MAVDLVAFASGVTKAMASRLGAHLLAMELKDLDERFIGLLTLAYEIRKELEGAERDENAVFKDYNDALRTLLEGLKSEYSFDFNLPPVQAEHVNQVLRRDLPKQFEHDFMSVITVFSTIFIKITYALEGRYPDIDIPGLLQEVALHSADGSADI